ncbi:phytoene desaturase family protein [Salinibacterium sp. SYSU T00001]|uniref:phytoene desaturase family protein n=1 Tax=Homoserinimonas sedimenticola TaxID=2986805 RepID=UPI0022363E94|nr:phytoene desaturase family protein [Salinibacterium sedimenticola]MCW4385619.1 phytoene desaturase family protein [Salinibacterium sedimenticola]
MSAPNPQTVVVVGGGITGLATAGLLAREGHVVTLLEKQPKVGGRAGLLEVEGFRFDTGPSWYLMPEVFDHFFRLMGTSAAEQLELVKLDPGYRVFFEGSPEPIAITSEREANIELFESIEPGAGRRLSRYLDSAADTYEMAKRRFLYSTFESFRPLLARDVLGRLPRLARLLLRSLDRHAASVTRDPRLQQILGYPAVFLGSSPFETPSMYHLMSHLDMTDGVYYPKGGFTRVIDRIAALASEAGVDIRTSSPVARILVSDGVATGVELADGTIIEADLVVSTADLHHSETQLLEREHQTYPAEYWQKRVAGPGAMLLYLGVEGELPQLDHHTLLFARDWRANFDAIFGKSPSIPSVPSLYICKPSGVDPDVAPAGHSNVFVLVPIPADPSLTQLDELADRVIEQIAEWTGIPDLAGRTVVRRMVGPADFAADLNVWKGSALGPAHTLKQSAFFRGANVSKHVSGLLYAGSSSIPGIGLPMCLISAELVLKRLRGDTSTEALPEPLPEPATSFVDPTDTGQGAGSSESPGGP